MPILWVPRPPCRTAKQDNGAEPARHGAIHLPHTVWGSAWAASTLLESFFLKALKPMLTGVFLYLLNNLTCLLNCCWHLLVRLFLVLWLQSRIHLVNLLPALSFPEALLFSVNDTDSFPKAHSGMLRSPAKTSLLSSRTRSPTACSVPPRECSKGIPKVTEIKRANCSPEMSVSSGGRQTLQCAGTGRPARSPRCHRFLQTDPRATNKLVPL